MGLLLWTVLVGAAIWLLRRHGDFDAGRHVLVLRETGDGTGSWAARLQRWLLLAHFGLRPVYPWVFLAPYVLAFATRFPVEADRWRLRLALHAGFGAACVAGASLFNQWVAPPRADVVVFAVVESHTGPGPNPWEAPPRPGSPDPVGDRAQARRLETHGPVRRFGEPDGPTPGRLTNLGLTIDPFDSSRVSIPPMIGLLSNFLTRLEEQRSTSGPPMASAAAIESRAVRIVTETDDSEVSTNRNPDVPGDGTGGVGGTNESSRFSFEWGTSTGPGRLPLPPGADGFASVLAGCFGYASLVGLAHAVHFHRRYRERAHRALALESHLARARLHALQAQLQPHFLFNALNSVTTLLREDPRAAEEMLTSLGSLLRLVLARSERPEAPLREELRLLESYFEIQQVRFGPRLRFESDLPPEAMDCQVPVLLLQPLVENAIRHGIEPTGRPGVVRVVAAVRGGRLDLRVEDDGQGCVRGPNGEPRLGVGLSNVRARIEAQFGSEARLDFPDPDGPGFVVRLDLPVRSSVKTASPSATEAS